MQPILDIIFLSNAKSEEHHRLTLDAINSCRSTCGNYLINIIVIEQQRNVNYPNVTTITRTDAFNYNKFANIGIATGNAPYVMVANNDLIFNDNWLKPLLDANHPVVSPMSPSDKRQQNLTRNEIGTSIGKHFSGWCFMLTRKLWEEIGGLDEDFIFWCADDSVVQQCKALGILPMVVPESKVNHLISKTYNKSADYNPEYTWAMIYKFEQKFGINKFPNNARYLAWKKSQKLTN